MTKLLSAIDAEYVNLTTLSATQDGITPKINQEVIYLNQRDVDTQWQNSIGSFLRE